MTDTQTAAQTRPAQRWGSAETPTVKPRVGQRRGRGLGKEQVSVACAVAGSATMLTGHRSIRGLEPQAANPVHVGKKKEPAQVEV